MKHPVQPFIRRLVMIVLALSAGPVLGQPSVRGQWSPPFTLPLIAIHSALLPTGKVLLFSADHGVPGIHGWVLDPQTLNLTQVAPPPGWNPDCAGHSFLPDGRLLVAGGTLGFNPTRGPRDAYLFDATMVHAGGQPWARIADMRRGRWYPTNITLGDGRVVTMSGLNDTNGAINPDIECWDPAAPALPGSNWALLGQRSVSYYPYLHLLPTGLIFRSGPDRPTETFNPTTTQWNPVANTIATARLEAPSVLLPYNPARALHALRGGQFRRPLGRTPCARRPCPYLYLGLQQRRGHRHGPGYRGLLRVPEWKLLRFMRL